MACSIIRECATNKNYYYINVVCVQIVLHWGTNQGCGINQGNTISGNVREVVLLILQIFRPCSVCTISNLLYGGPKI